MSFLTDKSTRQIAFIVLCKKHSVAPKNKQNALQFLSIPENLVLVMLSREIPLLKGRRLAGNQKLERNLGGFGL